MNQNKLIYIGEIVGVFGIKGELKVRSESDFVDFRYRPNATIILKQKQTQTECVISSMRFHKNHILITINNLLDINKVECYVGSKVYSYDEEVPLEEDEYQIDSLIGLDVYNESGLKIGVVNDFIEVPQGHIMEVKTKADSFLIPFVDEYIIDIDELNNMIKIKELTQ